MRILKKHYNNTRNSIFFVQQTQKISDDHTQEENDMLSFVCEKDTRDDVIKKLIEKLNEQYKSNRFTSYNRPETLIENNYVDDLTPRDIERYNKMVEFMKANNIKKFPFTTYIEEESY